MIYRDNYFGILSILVSGPKYGEQIRNEFKQQFEEDMPRGSIYASLKRMEKSGLVALVEITTTPGGGNDKKHYALTEKGEEVFKEFLKYSEKVRRVAGELL
jgi:DNA-binding PadR family transcriptional regulator